MWRKYFKYFVHLKFDAMQRATYHTFNQRM